MFSLGYLLNFELGIPGWEEFSNPLPFLWMQAGLLLLTWVSSSWGQRCEISQTDAHVVGVLLHILNKKKQQQHQHQHPVQLQQELAASRHCTPNGRHYPNGLTCNDIDDVVLNALRRCASPAARCLLPAPAVSYCCLLLLSPTSCSLLLLPACSVDQFWTCCCCFWTVLIAVCLVF